MRLLLDCIVFVPFKKYAMNSLFSGPDYSDERTKDRHPSHIDPNTGTVEWVLRPKHNRPELSPELTVYDRRELARYGLNNEAVNGKAKRIYAAKGNTKAIQSGCRISLDYAKKLHAAFGRAAKQCK